MNPLQKFINDVGLIVEMWTVVYKQFVEHGYDSAEALVHTKAFMEAMIASQANGGKEQA